MNKPLQNKVAIVTGGGTGIGRAISCALAQRGVTVALTYSRSADDAKSTVHQIVNDGGTAIALCMDITSETAVQETFQTVADTFGGLHFLVNNAGVTRQFRFDDFDAITGEVWDELLTVNVKGTFYCCKAARSHLRVQPGASILNIGSIAGETGYGSSLPYSVSKSAVHGMTRSLARALAPHIRVNCIAPGAVETRWWHGHEEKMRALAGHVPLQRVSTPADIAELAISVLTADSLTGQVIKAENGQTL